MRNAYLSTLHKLAGENPQILALVSDNGAIVYDQFRADHPKQYVNFGISEANMVAAAAGLASCGKIPFAYTIIPFLTMRAYEHVRNDVCLQNQNVKLVGIGAGFVYSSLGPTHHAIEDLAIMRVLPNLTIICPASPLEAQKATLAAAALQGPVYLRLGTAREPEIYAGDYEFELGKAVTLLEGDDLTLVTTGSITYDAYQTALDLQKDGIHVRLINMHTIKPLDREALIRAAKETRAILTLEEHSVIGGLGSAVSETLLESGCGAVLFERMGLPDRFCKGYGSHQDVKRANGLSRQDLEQKLRGLLAKKVRSGGNAHGTC